jgi:3-isopropylmalate/(R)-2-methylmalate dehydratase large subunit
MKTLSQKIWASHVVHEEPGAPSLLYIVLHLVHEVTSPQAFSGLRERGLKVRRPDRTLGTVDHSIPTTDRSLPILDPIPPKQLSQFEANCAEFGIPCFGVKSEHQGICHVIGPEQGATQPGMTVVCGDSHTATHGAFGALALKTCWPHSACCSVLRLRSACAWMARSKPVLARRILFSL